MHRLLAVCLLAAAALIGGTQPIDAQKRMAAEPTRGIVRVKLQPEVARQVGRKARARAADGQLSTGASSLDKAVRRIKGISISPMLPDNPRFAAQRARFGLDQWYVVNFDQSVSPEQARKELAAVAGVIKSETVKPMVLKEGTGRFVKADLPRQAKAPASYPFNDPQLPSQWHYQNFGNIGNNVAGADINLFDAWKVTTGTKKVTVAIIDGGVDYRHEDLAANMFVNEAELNGTPGVDDDGNGYVDDIYGYNFCTNSGEVYPHSHGTHVAGTVAAVNNNGIGVAGVAGGDGTPGSGVKLLSCQTFDSRNGSGDGDFAKAIVYACEMGATIAQCSWGWDSPGYYEQAVMDAIDYFTATARSENMSGGLMIFATGNNGAEGDFYPAAYPKVVAVTAMTSELRPASYSNYGTYSDLIAPGGLLDYGESYGVLSTLPNNEYGFNEGTSMATPHVSGIAALILSKYGSPTFVNESLRTQLVTSVNDFYGYGDNEKYRGLYGSGYIDAAKALQMGDGKAPEPVGDFKLDAAQDYVVVEWTIPASGDNNVHSHIIYYSDKPFTASSDLSSLKSVIADTKFNSSGDIFSQEITGLDPLTTYYVAIMAVNRWGNAAPLSAVKSVRTNAGPEMTVDTDNISMSSSAAQPVAKASFGIGNDAEGLLKWESSKRTVSMTPASVSRPAPGRVAASFSGKLAGKSMAPASARISDDYEKTDYPKDLCLFDEMRANIGESDKSLPNSMAQWYRVDPERFPEGFNLTSIKIDGANGQNPVIQVYKGDMAISSASLLQTVEYQYFAYGYPVQLNEQLYFAPGESFWIAVHFEGNQEGYPLGMAYAASEGIANQSFMSNDLGKTWVQLSTALKGSSWESIAESMTWAITARSDNPDWSEVLDLNPASGTVRHGEKQTVEVAADGSKLVNGAYRFNINLTSNQTDKNTISIPVEYTVSGNAPDVVTPKIIDFGSLLVGQSKTLTVEVYNRGYGKFSGSSFGNGIYSDKIQSTSEHFAGPDYIQEGFPARSRVSFDVAYKPVSAGSHTGNIVFTDSEGREVRLVVRGVATDPSKLAIEPATVEAGTLNVGDEPKTVSFTISNEGKYPLEFVFPKFSSETIEGAAAYHKFGYSVSSTLDGFPEFAYDGNPALIGGTDISGKFTDDNYMSAPVSMGFAFPYYGKNYEKVYISSFGTLTFAPSESTFRSPLTPDSYGVAGTGMIAAYGSQLMMGPASKVEYAKADGKFVVKFTDVLANVYEQEYTPVSFRIALASNGDIEIFYDSYDPTMVFQNGSGLFCGINDPDVADVITVTSADIADFWGAYPPTEENQRFTTFGTGTAVKFEAPKPAFIRSVNMPSGMVNPGESVDIKATVSADGTMDAGETFNSLAIMTNDPAPAHTAVRINATIAGEGLVPVAALEESRIDLGDVFRTADVKAQVTVKNNGHDKMEVTSASVADGKMTVAAETPFTLAPGAAKDLIVTVPTEREGAVSDVVNIATSAGDLSAEITANVIGCPSADLSLTAVEETVESGTPLHKELTVSNNGNETLLYAITPDPLVRMTLPDNADASTTYSYAFSGDDSSVKFDWVDIETNGLGTQHDMSYYNLHDYVAVDLPFEFPFYGKKYSRMYIYNTGFVSFTERHDDRLWPEPPGDFPQGSVYTNIIAPYWGLHSMDQTKTAGTYHYITDDRAVVSFMEYGNSMNLGVCFQLIMEKDGQFKFQYKPYNENAVIYGTFGLAGIDNLDASSYIKLPERMISFGSAVSFHPIVEAPVAPGKSETIGMDFDTDRMAGEYRTEIAVTTNVPGSERISIPVNLTVTGEAKPVWPADMEIEHTVGYQDTDFSNPLVQMGALYDAPFKVGNEGSAIFTIDMIETGGPTIYDEWFDEEMPVFSLFVKAPEIDWITGEPTGDKAWQAYQPGMPLSVDRDGLEFSIPMLPCEQASTPGLYEIPVKFTCTTEKGTEEKSMTVKFNVTPPPSMTLDKDEIRVKADTDDAVSIETLSIGNEGEYKLTYSLRLDPTGIGEETPDFGGGGIDPMRHAKATANARSMASTEAAVLAEGGLAGKIRPNDASNAFDLPSDFEFNDALYYPAVPGSRAVYNYGSQTLYDTFKAAVSFQAPEDGFNISHIYIPVTIEEATNYKVDIDIVQGYDPDGENILGHGTLTIASQANPQEGKFYVVPLEKPVFLNPGEEFNVVATYGTGAKMPAYVVAKEEAVVSGRYQGWTEQFGWFDIGELFKDQYGSLGYILSCLETQEGQPWIRLLTTETEGTVEIGGKAEVKVAVNAASARMEKNNKAMLVIKSNDPDQPLVNFPIVLDCNGRPMITAPSATIAAKEGETTEVALSVAEPDLDAMTISLSDAAAHVRIVSVKAAEGDSHASVKLNDDGSYSVAGAAMPVDVNVAIEPDFGSASTGNLFTLRATDDRQHSAEASVRYDIVRVNRAPVPVETESVKTNLGGTSSVVNFESLFNDPDGDELTFTFSMPDNDFAEPFTTNHGVIFSGKKKGNVTASVTATDPEGASATNTFTVAVDDFSGIDEIGFEEGDGGIRVTPNPVHDSINAVCGFTATDVEFTLYSTEGQAVARTVADVAEGETVRIDVADLPAAIYILTVHHGDTTLTERIVKR